MSFGLRQRWNWESIGAGLEICQKWKYKTIGDGNTKVLEMKSKAIGMPLSLSLNKSGWKFEIHWDGVEDGKGKLWRKLLMQLWTNVTRSSGSLKTHPLQKFHKRQKQPAQENGLSHLRSCSCLGSFSDEKGTM